MSASSASVLPSASEKSGRAYHLPSLDGLRAISIAAVLIGHLSGTRNFVNVDPGIGDYAHLGVIVFFVISGFLITRLLLIEQTKNGAISLKRFYARRTLRLFPAMYTYVACVCLLAWLGVVHLRATDIWHSITYTVNFLPDRAKAIGHLWSLANEEQFYLLWPCTLVLLGTRRANWAAAAAILLGPLARIFARFGLMGSPYQYLPMFPMVADTIATGCLLASLSGWLETQDWYLRLFRPVYSFGLLALILGINRYMGYTPVWVFGTSLVNVCIAVLVHRSIYCSRDLAGRILNWKPISFIGVLSYSLYIWQQLFLYRESSAWINRFPQNLILAVATALLSYYLLEKPVLKLRRRLQA